MHIGRHIYLLMLVLTAVLASCSESDDYEEQQDCHDGFKLSLSLQCTHTDTRAAQVDGVEGLNENLITTLDCFFYAISADDNTQSVTRRTISGLSAQSSLTVNTYFGINEIEDIFGTSGTQCKLYVIANLPEGTIVDSNKTSVNELKKMVITNETFAANAVQESFVMDSEGSSVVTLDRPSKKLSGSADLKRSASKITLTVTSIKDVIENEGTAEEIHWTADPKQIRAYINYGVKKSYIDTDRFPFAANTSTDYFSMSDDSPVSFQEKASYKNGAGSTVYEQSVPFYSYSSSWADKKSLEPYILLVVPWKKEGVENKYSPCYYQIPVHSNGTDIVRNHYYKINLSVSTLGSFEKEKALPLTPSYIIADWSTNTIDATLTDFRYLMVEQTSILLNNRDTVEIKYSSSHPIEIWDAKITQTDLHSNIPVEKDITDNFTIVDTPEKHYIRYERNLNNVYNDPNFDFTPYSISFTVRHIDKVQYNEKITMKQYPAIYAMYEPNSDFVSETETTDNNNKNHGYVYVNGYYSTNYYTHEGLVDQDFFCSSAGINGYVTGDYSPNRYIFTITSVRGTDYVIGDPRVKEPSAELIDAKRVYNNPDNNATAWVSAPSLDEGGVINNTPRGLQYYYPTDNSDNTLNMVSPKFIIASTYGALFTNSNPGHYLDAIRKRCASYQEDGYPAGRWRVPTKAEMEFVIYLVNQKKLPSIYNRGESYWSAHGLCHIDPTTGAVSLERIDYDPNQDYSVRCVYDVWYWKDKIPESDKSKFVWGDRPRK